MIIKLKIYCYHYKNYVIDKKNEQKIFDMHLKLI